MWRPRRGRIWLGSTGPRTRRHRTRSGSRRRTLREDREDEGRRTQLGPTRPSTGSTWTRGPTVSVTVRCIGRRGDAPATLVAAASRELVQPDGLNEGSKRWCEPTRGTQATSALVALGEVGVRSHVSEPERGRRRWQDKKTGETPPEKRAAQKALYANRRRVRGRRGRRLQRRRGEVVERTFAHMYETGVCVACGCAVTRMSASAC